MIAPGEDRPWLFCQLGAREHYILPRAFHRKGHLRALITDSWVRQGSLVSRIPGTIGHRFADRFSPDLADAPVHAFTGAGLVSEIGRRLRGGKADRWRIIMARNSWFERHAVARMKSAGLLAGAPRPIVFAYSYAALGILRAAKAAGCYTILGQIDPAIAEENIVAEAVAGHEALRPDWERAPAAYWARWIEECQIADRIVVNSEWARQGLLSAGCDGAKLAVVPLAYEGGQSETVRAYPDRFDDARPLRILFLGSLVIRKGIAELLDAAALLADHPVEFHFVGQEAISFPPAALANPRIVRHGPAARGDVAAHYAAADVFILPSLSDGFGLTQIEAQAYGLPVIASRHCGDVVRDEENGLILEEVSGAAIAAAIRHYLQDPAAVARHSRRASESLARFAPDAVAQQLIEAARV